jgi:hypothetical protein
MTLPTFTEGQQLHAADLNTVVASVATSVQQDGSGNASIAGTLTAAGASVTGGATLGGATNFPYQAAYLSKPASFSNTGLTITWDYNAGYGEVDFFLGPQGGGGGLNIYSLNGSGVVQQSPSAPIWRLASDGSTSQLGIATHSFAGFVAAGSGQSSATPVSSQFIVITNASPGQGIILEQPIGAAYFFIANITTSAVLIYPPVGAAFMGLATNVPFSLAATTPCIASFFFSTVWAINSGNLT